MKIVPSIRKTFVISGINLFEGGPLSILIDFLNYLNESNFSKEYKIVVLVHKKELFNQAVYPNLFFFEFPKSRTSYLYRLYYEYFYFKTFAIKNNVFFWLSLHDITPNLGSIPQAVYCHNPSPFNNINIKDIYFQPPIFFFGLFYKFLYKINIKRNKYVIVQQKWIKDKFAEMYNLNREHIIVAPPQIPQIPQHYINDSENGNGTKTFFFPTFPRPFKNIEVICEAVILLNQRKETNFKVIITVNGSENKYSKWIYDKYKDVENIGFIGLISREEVFNYYSKTDCLIFPSKLETWGLPITEFKQFNKHILIADLAYAKETISDYKSVNFFNPQNPYALADLMAAFINNISMNDNTQKLIYEKPYCNSWNELVKLILHK
jgi:glycosyltransferase involved in cell wall biosynthesis